MKLYVGLGNPGPKYTWTRHNIGFLAIDAIANAWGIEMNREKFKGIYGTGIVNGEKVYLLKPHTYMNLSGECVRPLMEYFNIDVEDIIVIYDDLDLANGKLRLRTKGSAGGHNGIKSLIAHLGTQQFNRARIGIGRPEGRQPVVDYVLGNFTDEELQTMEPALNDTVKACEHFLKESFVATMNVYNKK